jgi:site-specific recombinase XerD
MDTALATRQTTVGVIVPDGATGDPKHRLGKFADWMDDHSLPWYAPNLAAYRDYLLDSLSSASVASHLATVRARYATLIRDDARRDELYSLAGERLQAMGQADTPADRKAFVDELVTRLQNALDPATAPVKTKTIQDRPDSDHLRLTSEQASALMAAPGVDTLRGLRDTAVISLLLCTGVREAELSALDVRDLRQSLGSELALHVREGKGAKERLVPYGALSWAVVIVEAWLNRTGITEGAIFRGLYKGNRRPRPGRLSVRAIEYILENYPIALDGQLVKVKPHDCRRTYARRLYDAGVDVIAIQQNLGHADVKTTLGYIGELDASKRRAPAVYSFNLNDLFGQAEMEP